MPCGGGPEGHLPMEVPDLHVTLPNYRAPLPQRELSATVGLRAESLATRIHAHAFAVCMPVAQGFVAGAGSVTQITATQRVRKLIQRRVQPL